MGYLKFPCNFVAFNAENELIETEKLLQKDGNGELEICRPTCVPSDEIQRLEK